MGSDVIGRPTLYTPDLGEKILDLMADGLSLTAAAAELGIHRRRVYDWADAHPDFAEIVALAKSKRQLWLERRLLSADSSPVVVSTIFALKNGGQGDWVDRQEVVTENKHTISSEPEPMALEEWSKRHKAVISKE